MKKRKITFSKKNKTKLVILYNEIIFDVIYKARRISFNTFVKRVAYFCTLVVYTVYAIIRNELFIYPAEPFVSSVGIKKLPWSFRNILLYAYEYHFDKQTREGMVIQLVVVQHESN